VWVRPDETRVAEVGERLADGFHGIKLHPTVDGYRADTPSLDPYIEEARSSGRPVACHAAPGTADPDHIRALAERFPDVPLIMYHTYLGPDEGRRRAVRHAQEVPNLYLETSWCRSDIVLELIEQVGADRVLFGSDASIDGMPHYCRQPPNVEGVETYVDILNALAERLEPDQARKITSENARSLFGLPGPADGVLS
jgi:predicted TIM-barrel fold metal-dependent hydrolase